MPKASSATVARPARPRRTGPGRPAAARALEPRAAWLSLADAVTRGSCYAAVFALPLYFSVLTPSGYEPDKSALLRVFAALAGAAWLTRFVLSRPRLIELRQANPLLLLGGLVFLAYCIGTVLSIDPRESLWGSDTRQQGLWTHAAYFVFLAVAATSFRDRRNIERLIGVLLLGSVPVAIYGFLQQFGVDPIPSAGDPTTLQWPVRATFGQHVFLGDYLVLIIPFAAARLLREWERRNEPSSLKGQGDEVLLAGTAVAAIVLSFFLFLIVGVRREGLFVIYPALLAGYAGLALSLERLPDTDALRRARLAGYGALLLLLVVVLVMTGARGGWIGFFASVPVFAFLLAWRLRRPRIWQSIAAVTIAGGLFLLLLNLPSGPLQPLRTVHGLNRLSHLGLSGETESSAAGRLLIWQGVTDLMRHDPSVGGTWGGPLRDVVGYGPESMLYAFQATFPLKLRQQTGETWTWDRAHDIYLDYLIDAGLIALLAILALVVLFFRRIWLAIREADRDSAFILMALASAMVAYLFDGIFALGFAVTFLLFWLMLGLAAGYPWRATPDSSQVDAEISPRGTIWYWAGFLVLALVVIVISSIDTHPAVMAALWLLAAVMGVGLLAALTAPSLAQMSVLRRLRVPWAVLLPVALGVVLALGSQMRFETAAMADRLGMAQLGQGQSIAAVGYLQEAVTANGYDPLYPTHLGGAYMTLAANRGDSALPTYQPPAGAYRTIDAQSPFFVQLGQDQVFQLAEESLQQARALAPLDPDSYNNLGNLYNGWGRYDLALSAFQQGESLSVDNPRFYDQEAITQLDGGQPQQATASMMQAYRLDKDFWYTYYVAALIQHDGGDRASAERSARVALKLVATVWPPPAQAQISRLRSLAHSG